MNPALTIHQYHSKATAGDAVTRHMFFIQEALKASGIDGKMFATQRKNLAQGRVLEWSLDSVWNCDLLVVHHSQTNPNLKEILELEIPKVVIYHSQPPETFFSHDPDLRYQIKKSKSQLGAIRKAGIPVLAVSQFAADELVELGFSRPGLIPLLHLEENSKSQFVLDPKEAKNILFVGKIAPHKKQSLLIETFSHLRKFLPDHSRLILVGTGDPLYGKYLKLLLKQWKLSDQVVMAGKVTDQDLSHYYEMADLFVCLSEHEGFCLPVVEAMKAGVPVFYRPTSGVKETMGQSGVQLLSKDPVEIAAVLRSFLENPQALKGVLEKQALRLRELSPFQNREQVTQVLTGFCKTKRPSNSPSKKEKLLYDATFSL